MIKFKRMIQKLIILKYRFFKTPVLMIFGRNTIKVIYGRNNKYLSFHESMYYTSVLESIEHTNKLTGKKPKLIIV
jgi:hypothetical protein